MSDDNEVWLVYDGECPICKPAANSLKIKPEAGELKLADKRTSTAPIIAELKEKGFNLENGMIIKKDGNYFQGADALYVTAKISNGADFKNRLNICLFKSETRVRLLYPALKFIRKIALCAKGVPPVKS